jgi:hypothetical protein
LIALRAISLVCWPLSMSAAGAAAVEAPKATLIRLELQPFETPSPVTAATATCVTLIQAHDFDAARRACDAAVSDAETERSGSRLVPAMGRPYADVAAVAYNNRAVLRLLTGQLELAAADSARALKANRMAPVERTAAVIALRQRRAVAAD